MFIQVIQGKVGDESLLRDGMVRWEQELMPGAVGYLGTTAGFTDDGRFVALARFESAEAARANSDRREQGGWWSEMEKGFDGEPTFMDTENVRSLLDGGSDDAGFVQVMAGRSDDAARMNQLLSSHADDLRKARPEIIGGLMLEFPDGRYVHAIYFASEQAARKGEAQESPESVRADLDEVMGLMGDVTYYDLKDPQLVTAPS